MTIRDELREMYQKRKAIWKEYNKVEAEDDARKFIEETIIVKFREIAIKIPDRDYIFVEFDYSPNWTLFFSSIDSIKYMPKDCPISKETMDIAICLAKKEYDISVFVEESLVQNTRYIFFLELS